MTVRNIYLLLFLFVSIVHKSHANFLIDFEYKNYTWQFSRNLYSLTPTELEKPFIILKDKRVVEYVYDNSQQTSLTQVTTVHKIISINSIEAVQQCNKIYIPIANSLNIITLKARFIAKNGAITEVNPSNIKLLQNINNAGNFQIFAIEGVEVGGEIEYYYSTTQKANYFGREIFQSNSFVRELDFELITPKNLIFETKSYNQLPEAIQGNLYETKNNWTVKGIYNFTTQNNNALSMRLDFKLASHQNQPTKKLFTWNEAGKNIAESYYVSKKISQDELQNCKQVLKIILANSSDEKSSIAAIEDFIKQNIVIDDKCTTENPQLILQNKCTNKQGALKLFTLFFELAAIPHQIVATSNKNQAKFDKEFENWIFLEAYLFYFPRQKLFLAPHHTHYTLGLIPAYLTGQDGIFVDYSFQVATTTIQEIPAIAAHFTIDESEFDLEFYPQSFQIGGTWKRSFSGYYATALASAYEQTTNKQHLSEKIFRASIANAALADTKIVKPTPNHLANNNFLKLETSLLATTLLEKSGNHFLFRVGDLLSQEFKEGTLGDKIVEQDFNKIFKRKISFIIPPNYVIRNLENLTYQVGEKGQKIWFYTTYKLENNWVEVTINGGSQQLIYEDKDKELLLEVTNAMKNFSQMVLVFQKIK